MVLTAGIISLISAGSNSAKLSTTPASGGIAPYTQQWFRDTSGPGFTPDVGNRIQNATGLILNDSGLVPNTTYYYKIIYADSAPSTAISAVFIVTTLPASQGMNQFSMAALLGSMDLQVGPKNVFSAQIDVSQINPLYAGQPIKFVNNLYGIPTVVSTGTDMPNGYVLYDQKSQNFPLGACCEIAKTLSCIWLYATAPITRGAMVTLDPTIASGVKQITGSSALPIIGEAFDSASATGQLIRIILDTPSNMIDTNEFGGITSNVLEIDSVLDENEDLVQNLLKSTVNGLPSNQVAVQIPVSSPINNNLMAMDANGNNKDSGVQVTTSQSSNDNSHVPTSAAMQSAIAAFVGSPLHFVGGYNASTNLFPTVGSGSGGAVQKGDVWSITVAGTLGGKAVYPNDTILALVNVPGQTAGNWAINSAAVVTNSLTLTGNSLKSTVNAIDSDSVNVQIPIPSPTNNNLVSMDASGFVKDSGVQTTTLVPNTQKFITAGSHSYVPTVVSGRSPKYIRLRLAGAGGGASGSSESFSSAYDGTDGGDSTFTSISTSISCHGGKAGTASDVGEGGTVSVTSSSTGIAQKGQNGGYGGGASFGNGFGASGDPTYIDPYFGGAIGGNSLFGGGGNGIGPIFGGTAPLDAVPNSGGGGAGPGMDCPSISPYIFDAGVGGGGGGWVDYLLPALAATIVLGAKGIGGGPGVGTRAAKGGDGSDGVAVIDEFY